jgi:CSLREA domain-containing protein
MHMVSWVLVERLGAVVAAATLALTIGATPTNAAGITVNTLADVAGPPECSLRDAIMAASTDTAQGGCTAGIGADAISFSVAGTITLGSSLPDITADVTVDGGGTISVDGAGKYRPFSIDGAAVTLTGLTITHGSASHGGGINSTGTLTVEDSTISASTAEISGGGINSEVKLTVTGSTICGNTSLTEGGGISFDGTASITNSTICENTAVRVGGGIVAWGPATIINTTVVANVAQGFMIQVGHIALPGGGINTYAPGSHLVNSIFAGNEGGDTAGPIVTKASITPSTGSTGLAMSDLFVVDGSRKPVLNDNGGPTKTIALAPGAGNPAIDTANSAVCAAAPVSGEDQRGFARPSACDMGAYEAGAPMQSPTPTPTPTGGGVSNDPISAPLLVAGLLVIVGLIGLAGIVLVAQRRRTS